MSGSIVVASVREYSFSAKCRSRFVAGVRRTSCTEMHYSPRNMPQRDPGPTSVFLCSALPLPFSPSPGPVPLRPLAMGPLRLERALLHTGTMVA